MYCNRELYLDFYQPISGKQRFGSSSYNLKPLFSQLVFTASAAFPMDCLYLWSEMGCRNFSISGTSVHAQNNSEF